MIVAISCIVVLLGIVGYLIWRVRRKEIKQKFRSANYAEFEKALRQAEKYSDKEGWIAIRFLDRDKYLEIR